MNVKLGSLLLGCGDKREKKTSDKYHTVTLFQAQKGHRGNLVTATKWML